MRLKDTETAVIICSVSRCSFIITYGKYHNLLLQISADTTAQSVNDHVFLRHFR